MQPQIVIAVILAALGPLVARKHIFTADQFSTYVTATVQFLFSYGIPMAMTIYAWWQTRHTSLIRATASLPGVIRVRLWSQAKADDAAHPKVVGPEQ